MAARSSRLLRSAAAALGVRPIFVANGSVGYELGLAARQLPLFTSSPPSVAYPTMDSGAMASVSGVASSSSRATGASLSRDVVLELTYPSTGGSKPQTKAHANPQVLMLHFPATAQRAAVFPEGSIVGFGFRSDQELDKVRAVMQPYEEARDPLLVPDKTVTISSQSFTVAAPQDDSSYATSPAFSIDPLSGALLLASFSASVLLPCAMCLVELVQIRALGTLLEPVAHDTSRWRNAVMAKGTLPFSLKQARKRKAQVLRISSRQMKLASKRHQLFWDSHHAELRQAFTLACEHYELTTAHSELRERVDAVAQTLVYLSEEAHADTNHRLEWVIILLISLEVVISVKIHRDD